MELRNLINILYRRRKLMFYIIAGVVVTVALVLSAVEDRYKATAKVYLRKSGYITSALNSMNILGSSSEGSISDTERYNKIALCTSYPVVERVIKELNLKRPYKWAQLIEMIPLVRPVMRLVGVKFPQKEVKPEDITKKSVLYFFFPSPYIKAAQFEDTDIIDITANACTLEEAIALANATAESYRQEEINIVKSDYQVLSEIVKKAMPDIKEKYSKAVIELKDFQIREGIISTTGERDNLITKISTVKTEIESCLINKQKVQKMIDSITEQLRKTPQFRKSQVSYTKNSVITTLEQTLNTRYLELAQAKAKYTENHPSVQTLEAQVKQAKNILEKETKRVLDTETLSNDSVYKNLTEYLSSYLTALASYESQELAYRELSKEYEEQLRKFPEKTAANIRLSANLDAYESYYKSLLKANWVIDVGEDVTVSNAVTLAKATEPVTRSTAKQPQFGLYIIIAFAGSVFLAIATALMIDYTDDKVYITNNVSQIGSVPVLAVFSDLLGLESRAGKRVPDPLKSSRLLYAKLFCNNSENIKFISMFSLMHQKKIFDIAQSLALNTVEYGRKVLIVSVNSAESDDLDLKLSIRGKAASPETNFISNNVKQIAPGLDCYKLNLDNEVLRACLKSPLFAQDFQHISSFYDQVILSCSQVCGFEDVILFSPNSSRSILVINNGEVNYNDLMQYIELIRSRSAQFCGIVSVCNDSKDRISVSVIKSDILAACSWIKQSITGLIL